MKLSSLFPSLLVMGLLAAGPAHAGHIDFYEGNAQGGDLLGTLPDDRKTDFNLTSDSVWGGVNDEIRSIKLRWVTPGTVIELYDSPSASRRDDYVTIVVKKWEDEINIRGLEMNSSNSKYDMVYDKDDGNLNGKVSRIRVIPAKAYEPPLEARLNLCMQNVFEFRKQEGRAEELKRQGSDYRTKYPDFTMRRDGGFAMYWQMDHIRGMGSDDHAFITLDFNTDRTLKDAKLEIEMDDKKLAVLADELLKDIPDEVKKTKYGMIAEVSARSAAKLYDFSMSLAEHGGRKNFSKVVDEVMNDYGNAIIDCDASLYPAPPQPVSNPADDVNPAGMSRPAPLATPRIVPDLGAGRYRYQAVFVSKFDRMLTFNMNGRLRYCEEGTTQCVWHSDDSSPSVEGCRKMRDKAGKQVTAYGFKGKYLSRDQIARCNS